MLLIAIPELPRYILLTLIGAILGAAVNWAIYRWTYFRKRSVSPWLPADEKAFPRKTFDFIPVLGWLGMRRDVHVHGRGFWIRPLLIECVWMLGLPLFFNWHAENGLSGKAIYPSQVCETWFLIQTVMLALLTVATFIDFDEQTIPDGVTVTGLIFALVIAALVPTSPLPVVTRAGIDSHLHFNSPLQLTMWHQGWLGLAIAIAILAIWYFALLPKTINWRLGPSKAVKIMFASIIRPPRKTESKLVIRPRKPMLLTKILTLVWAVGTAAIVVSWLMLPDENKISLFSAFVGMAVGGGLVWAIRIIGSLSMGQEAMGFGDVTLMFMIGAFLGWQPALMIVFGLAPLSALLIAVVHLVVTGESKLAFGPYLCFGALILILYWSSIWRAVGFVFFGIGGTSLLIIGVSALVLMGPMLYGMQWLKYKLNPDVDE